MTDVFLSYSRADQPLARQFAEALGEAGFSVWWDQALRSGEAYDRVTEKALEEAGAVIVLWSRTSVESRWVRIEATQADRRGALVPVAIEPCKRPIMFDLTQTADLSGWRGDTHDPRWQALCDDVRVLVGRSTAPAPPAAAPAPAVRGRRAGLVGAVMLALALALAGIGWWALDRRSDASHTQAAPARTSADQTLAVLPFVYIGPTQDEEYFADGITVAVQDALSGIAGLQLTARNSSSRFNSSSEDRSLIREQLNVENLIEGSVQSNGEQLRITVNLTQRGINRWSQTYDRPVGDLFKVQEDIARNVAQVLQISLGVGDLGRVPGMTRDARAYLAWLGSIPLRAKVTQESNGHAIEKLEEAVNRDPAFMLGWFDLHLAYSNVADNQPRDSVLSRTFNEKSEAALAQAKRLAPPGTILDGPSLWGQGKWAEGERALESMTPYRQMRRALGTAPEADPRYATLVLVDRAQLAIDGLERDRTRDPLNVGIARFLSLAYADTGQFDKARAEGDRGLRLAPGDTMLAFNALMVEGTAGDPRSVEAAFRRLSDIMKDSDSAIASLYALRGKPDAARAELRRLVAARPDVTWRARLAPLAAFFDDDEFALQLLREDSAQELRLQSAGLLWRPVMADVRRLPGFKDLVRDWGLVEYWREFGWGDHCKPVGEADFTCS